MANYTLELRQITESKNMCLFDFDYDFYEPDLKTLFENKFTDYYFFNEIGFETVQMFKHALRTKLNTIMPYYSQLYQTELRSKDIDFMLNKDYVETITRELSSLGKNQNGSSSNASTQNTATGNEGSTFKESSLNNGNASLSLDDLTTINNSDNNFSNTNKGTSTTTSNTTGINEGSETETITNKGQGNIGITSSAELLEKWRKVLINIDMMIIEDCRDLFMGVF